VLDRKYWVDNVYFAVFARGGVKLGRCSGRADDTAVIDDVMVNGSVSMIHRIAATCVVCSRVISITTPSR
jgi:NADH-quinone oxidoreductase subunit L